MEILKTRNLIIALFIVLFSCSGDADPDPFNPENEMSDTLVRYEIEANKNNQLLAESFIAEYNATTYFYGRIDDNNNIVSVESLAFKENNSDEVQFFILDNFYRVTQIYSEVNGVKKNEVQYFYYEEPGLINYVVAEKNWATNEDNVIHFSTVEVDGDDYNINTLLGKDSAVTGNEWSYALISNLIAVGVVAAAAITIAVVAKSVGTIAAVIAGLTFVGAALASEEPVAVSNPNAPNSPNSSSQNNPCVNSKLSVIIGVDPGNELYAIVNGDSDYYDFYWSTGENDIGLITSHITAPDDGTYYVMVKDEKGCIAFASTSPIIVPISWYKGSYTLIHYEGVDYNNCGTQSGQSGDFYIYVAQVGSSTKGAVYIKSITPGMPNVYTKADPYEKQVGSWGNVYDTHFNPLIWWDSAGFNGTQGSKTMSVDLPEMRLDETTNSLYDTERYPSTLLAGRIWKYEEPTADNIECQFIDNAGNPFTMEYFYFLTDVTAEYIGTVTPDGISDYELANMEMVLYNNDIWRFSSVD